MSHPFRTLVPWPRRCPRRPFRRPSWRSSTAFSCAPSARCKRSCARARPSRSRVIRPAASSSASPKANGSPPREWPCSPPWWSNGRLCQRGARLGPGLVGHLVGHLGRGGQRTPGRGRTGRRRPSLKGALHEGELSAAQLSVLTQAASEAPASTGDLLELLGQGASHQELTDAAARAKAAARSRETEHLRRARVHAHRHLRAHQVDSGGVRAEIFCDEVAWAKVAPSIEARAKELWKAAGGSGGAAGSGGCEALEAYRLTPSSNSSAAATGRAARTGQGARTDQGAGVVAPKGPGARPSSSSTPPPCAGGRPKATSCARSRASAPSRSRPPPNSSQNRACATSSARASTSRP